MFIITTTFAYTHALPDADGTSDIHSVPHDDALAHAYA